MSKGGVKVGNKPGRYRLLVLGFVIVELVKDPTTLKELATKIGVNTRSTRRLLSNLRAAGLVRRCEMKSSNTEAKWMARVRIQELKA